MMSGDDDSRTLKQLLKRQPVNWNEVQNCIQLHPDQVTDKRLRAMVQKPNVPNEIIHAMLETSPGCVSYKTLKYTFFNSEPQNHLTFECKKEIFSHSTLMIAMKHECRSTTNGIQCDLSLRSRFARRRLSNLLFSYGCDKASARLQVGDFITNMHHLLMVCPHFSYKTLIRNCMTENMGNSNNNRNIEEIMPHMKRLLRYLLLDAPEKITTIARDQLDYDELLEIAEEPWLLRYLISIYPECLHTQDEYGCFLLYDLALYNCKLLENLPCVLQKCIEIKVDGDHNMMGGLLSKPDSNGDDENPMSAIERILCSDYHWDKDYKMKVLRVVLQVSCKEEYYQD